jgi:uncharacterized CHY-type Zn-finger protein
MILMISSYVVKKIPKEPWNPPGYKPKFCKWCKGLLTKDWEKNKSECAICQRLFERINKKPDIAQKILFHIRTENCSIKEILKKSFYWSKNKDSKSCKWCKDSLTEKRAKESNECIFCRDLFVRIKRDPTAAGKILLHVRLP